MKSKWRANSEVVFESEPAGDEIRKAISPYQVVKGVEQGQGRHSLFNIVNRFVIHDCGVLALEYAGLLTATGLNDTI